MEELRSTELSYVARSGPDWMVYGRWVVTVKMILAVERHFCLGGLVEHWRGGMFSHFVIYYRIGLRFRKEHVTRPTRGESVSLSPTRTLVLSARHKSRKNFYSLY